MTSNATAASIESELEALRPELTGYCYRMLASPFDADDAVQETILRAWRAAGDFERRASVRTWVYQIATNVCIDMADGRERRASCATCCTSAHPSAPTCCSAARSQVPRASTCSS